MALPSFVGSGAKADATTGAVSVPLHASTAVGHFVLLVATTIAGGSVSITDNGGSAWTAFTGSPSDGGGDEKLYAWWRIHQTGDSAPSVQASSDHVTCSTATWSGQTTASPPFEALVFSFETTSDTSYSFATGVSTTKNNCIVISAATSGMDSLTGQYGASVANASLSSLASVINNQTNKGGGGGYGINYGSRATAGSCGTWSMTLPNATKKDYVSFALIGAPLTATLGLITETDVALALSRAKRLGIGLASSTDSAQASEKQKRLAVALATETDATFAAGRSKQRTLGLSAESDAANPATKEKRAALALASESDSALATSLRRQATLSLISETDSSLPTGKTKRLGVGLATEAGIALQATAAKGRTLGLPTETVAPFSLGRTKRRETGLATETGSALSLGRTKSRALALTTEIDVAFSPTSSVAQRINVGLVTETDAALSIARRTRGRLDRRFGLNNSYPQFAIQQLASGARYSRGFWRWSDIEPNAPVGGVHTYVWTLLDAAYARAIEDGVSLVVGFVSCPEWAQTRPYTGDPSCHLVNGLCGIVDMTNFYALVFAAASRYPLILHWEIGNEVTASPFFEKNDDNPYIAWLIAGYRAVKAANPTAKVLLAGLVDPRDISTAILIPFLVEMRPYYDILNFHIYGEDDDVTAALDWLLFMLTKQSAVRGIPIWITETAYYADTAQGANGLARLAREIAKRYARAFAGGVEVALWWQIQDGPIDDEDPTGDAQFATALGWAFKDDPTYTWHARTAEKAYRTTVRKMCDWTDFDEIGTGRYRMKFTGRRDCYLVWGAGSLPAEINGPLLVTSHLGTESVTTAGALTLGDDPLFIELLGNRRQSSVASGTGTRYTPSAATATRIAGGG